MDTELQFDQVQRPSATQCSACQTGLLGSYFQANGHVLCEKCANNIRNAFTGSEGGFLRFVKAVGLGIGGGIAGGAVYATVLAVAHINAALVTILIGWLVGKGVNRGNGGRGGVGYQILAVALTYMTIGLSAMLAEVLTSDAAHGSFIAGIFICLVGAVAGPVLMAMESPLGALITFFGLMQAWRTNHAVNVEVTGPHALAGAPQPTPAAVPPALPNATPEPLPGA